MRTDSCAKDVLMEMSLGPTERDYEVDGCIGLKTRDSKVTHLLLICLQASNATRFNKT